MPKRWLDVGPKDWFYRAVLETDNIFIDTKKKKPYLVEKPITNLLVASHVRFIISLQQRDKPSLK